MKITTPKRRVKIAKNIERHNSC